jgi:uncharacterized membrane protein YbhN (UPF0104 family)
MARSRLLKVLLQLALALLLGYFLLPILIDSIRKFDPSQWRINYWLLIASVLLMQVVLYCQSAIWSLIIRFFDKRLSLNKAFRIAYLAQLGRYLPGKVWQLFGMIYLAGKEGIKKEEATLSFILSQLFATPPGLVVVLFYLFIIGSASQFQVYQELAWIAGLIIVIFMLVFLWPGLFKASVNRLIRLLRQPQVEFRLEKRLGLRVLLAYFVTWNLYGLAFYLFLKALMPEQELPVLEVIGAWTLAYLIGYWTVVLPAGIGAREAVLLVLLTPVFQAQGTPELAGVAVVGARAWSIVGEIICTLLAWRVK